MSSRAQRGDLVVENGVEGGATLMRTKVRTPMDVIVSAAWQSRWWEWRLRSVWSFCGLKSALQWVSSRAQHGDLVGGYGG